MKINNPKKIIKRAEEYVPGYAGEEEEKKN